MQISFGLTLLVWMREIGGRNYDAIKSQFSKPFMNTSETNG